MNSTATNSAQNPKGTSRLSRRLLSRKDTVIMLDVSDAIVSRLVWVGKIPTARLARRIQLDAQDLGAFILHSKPRGSSGDRVAELGELGLEMLDLQHVVNLPRVCRLDGNTMDDVEGGEPNANPVPTREKEASRNRGSDRRGP